MFLYYCCFTAHLSLPFKSSLLQKAMCVSGQLTRLFGMVTATTGNGQQQQKADNSCDEEQKPKCENSNDGQKQQKGKNSKDGQQQQKGDNSSDGEQRQKGENSSGGQQQQKGDNSSDGEQRQKGENSQDGQQQQKGDNSSDGEQKLKCENSSDGQQQQKGDNSSDGEQRQKGENSSDGELLKNVHVVISSKVCCCLVFIVQSMFSGRVFYLSAALFLSACLKQSKFILLMPRHTQFHCTLEQTWEVFE
jgi:DNA mismatch repair ATPase MutL